MHKITIAAYALLVLWVTACGTVLGAAESCGQAGPALQILGSGGPIANDDRASSGYLLWNQGKARALIDAGGGTFVRFGAAGARIEDLDIIAISHLHVDHSADLAALLKSGYFSARKQPLAISGPSGSRWFPSMEAYMQGLLDADRGIYRYLSGYLDGKGGLFTLNTQTADTKASKPVTVNNSGNLQITALGVPHGPVPTLAYRFEIGGKRIVFGSDNNGSKPAFTQFAQGADVLVMHMAIPEDAHGPARNLHAPPSRIGEVAAQAEAGKLVLSHFMPRSLRDLQGNVDLVKEHYKGKVIVGKDLQCVPL